MPPKTTKKKTIKKKDTKTVKEKPSRKYTKRKKTKQVISSSSENEDTTGLTTTIEKVPPLKYKCPEYGCSMSFSLAATLQQHYRSHGPDKKPFKCSLPSCDKVYSRQADIYRHICNDHDLKSQGQKTLSKGEAKRYVIVLSDVIEREYQALGIKKYCKGDVYGDGANTEEIDEKLVGGNGIATTGNGTTAQPPIMPYFTTIRYAEGYYFCPFQKCSHLSKDRFTLKQHYRVHCGREYRPYLCSFNRTTCRYASNQKSAVEMHIRVAHFGLPAAKGRRKTTKMLGGESRNANKDKQNNVGGSDRLNILPTPARIVSLDSTGNEIETEEKTLASIGGVEEKTTALEVDVSRYVEVVTEWLEMEDKLFGSARVIRDDPTGFSFKNVLAIFGIHSRQEIQSSKARSVRKPPPHVVQLD